MRLLVQLTAVAMLACLASVPARADVFKTYNLAWSGQTFGNTAQATAQMVVDLSLITNPGNELANASLSPWIESITMTVTGATSGNGTFSTAGGDFWKDWWSTGGATLNLFQELVGQPVAGKTWGTSDGTATYGEFNLFSSTSAPTGTDNFTLTTAEGAGDPMYLTSFAPADLPEPTAFALFGTSLLLGGVALRRRRS